MMETILFPDAIDVCRTYLAEALVAQGDTQTHVGSRLSSDSRNVVLNLVDASIASLVIQTSTVRADCWVDETYGQEEAQTLGQLARGLLGAMRGTVQNGVTVYRIDDASSGLADLPDPISGKARYSFHFTISMRGSALT